MPTVAVFLFSIFDNQLGFSNHFQSLERNLLSSTREQLGRVVKLSVETGWMNGSSVKTIFKVFYQVNLHKLSRSGLCFSALFPFLCTIQLCPWFSLSLF